MFTFQTTGLRNTAGIGHDGIELAKNLRRDVKHRAGPARIKQTERSEMLRGVRVERTNQNVCVNNPRLNGHRRKHRGDGMSRSLRDARLAIQGPGHGAAFIFKQAQYGVFHQVLGISPGFSGNLCQLRFLLRREVYFHALKIRRKARL